MKTYKNISGAPVLGHAPGKVFELDPDDLVPGQLARLVARNSIEEVEKSELPTDTPDEDTTVVTDHDNPDGGDANKVEEKTTPPALAVAASKTSPTPSRKG